MKDNQKLNVRSSDDPRRIEFSGVTGISGTTGMQGVTGLSGETGFHGVTGIVGAGPGETSVGEVEMPIAVSKGSSSVGLTEKLYKKAMKCISISRRMFPGVTEDIIEKMAAQLMNLPEDEIAARLLSKKENLVYSQKDCKDQKEMSDEHKLLRNIRCSVEIKN